MRETEQGWPCKTMALLEQRFKNEYTVGVKSYRRITRREDGST